MPEPMSKFAVVAEQAARAGGRVLKELLGRAAAREKGPKDLVTQADMESQRVIRDIVLNSFPGHDFLGEEDGPEPAGRAGGSSPWRSVDGYRWIVDPLDGTANYVHGLPGFAVSVGLEKDGSFVAGAVFDPTLNECFVAGLGTGTFLNGKPVRTSSCRSLRDAMVAVSLSPHIHRDSAEVHAFVETLLTCHSVRRLGSAALNLCYLAAGRLDAYWTTSVKIWDVAAGILMVQEAGGVVSDIDGSAFKKELPRCAGAASPALHQELVGMLR